MRLKHMAVLTALFVGYGYSKEKAPQKAVFRCISKKNAIWTDEPRIQKDNDTQFIFSISTQKIQLSKQYTNYSPPKVIWTMDLEPVSYENELNLDPNQLDVFRAKDSSFMLQMAINSKSNSVMFTTAGFSSGILFIDSGECRKQ